MRLIYRFIHQVYRLIGQVYWPTRRAYRLLCLLWLCAPAVQAACQFQGDTPTLYGHPGRTVQVAQDTAVGQHPFDFGGAAGSQSWTVTCTGSEPAGYVNQVGALAPLGRAPGQYGNSTWVYQIAALPGLGYAPSWNMSNGGLNSYFAPYGELNAPADYRLDDPGSMRIDFFVMSPLWSGRWCLPAGQTLGDIRFDSTSVARLVVSGSPLCIEVNGATCQVAAGSSQQTVLLGRHVLSDFQRPGTTTPARPFQIGLTRCAAGIAAVNLRFVASEESDYAQAGDLGLVALNPGGAQGVAVQLLDGNSRPFPLNRFPDLPVWQGSPLTGESELTLPFFARYYQTRDQVSAGPAQASVLFEVVYR